ncbi:MAG TPA: DUF998 domain-containing protein [Candidatus Dormibacteraeota bacterium]|nr:DUF998 domain-containing protein [Candidatus Dormibacteraeota bacterium]
MTLLLIALGICGALLFAAVWLIEGATRPGYSAWAHTISALSLGPSGWVQRLNFIIFGALTLGSALGWRQALAHGVGAVAYPVLKAIEGVGLIVDGVFSQDPLAGYPPGALITGPTVHGVIHVTFAIITITAIGLDWFVLARRFAGDPTWRGWGKYAVITGVLTIVFIAISGPMVLWGGLAGLFERLSTESSAPLGLLILGRLLLQARGAGWSGALGRSRV